MAQNDQPPKWMVFLLNMIIIGTIILSQIHLLAICSDYFWLLSLGNEVFAGPHLFFWTWSTDQGHFSGKVAWNLGARLGQEWVKSIDPPKVDISISIDGSIVLNTHVHFVVIFLTHVWPIPTCQQPRSCQNMRVGPVQASSTSLWTVLHIATVCPQWWVKLHWWMLLVLGKMRGTNHWIGHVVPYYWTNTHTFHKMAHFLNQAAPRNSLPCCPW